MRKINILTLIFFSFIKGLNSQVVWDGGGTTNNFSEAANWLPDGVPSGGANIIFDGTSSKNCDFDAQIAPGVIAVNNINISAAYTGVINGISSAIGVNDFSQAGGTFISTSDVLELSGNFVRSGGTFTHNNGTVIFYVAAGGASSISGAVTFNILRIESTTPSAGVERVMQFGTSTTTGTLILNPAAKLASYQGNISITSLLNIQGVNSGNPTSNSGTFTFSGAGPITITGSGAAARNKVPNLVFNTSGTINMTGQINLQGNWTGTQGTLSSGTSTTNLYATNTTISGSAVAFHNLAVQSGVTASLPAAEVKIGGSLTNSGTINYSSSGAIGFNAASGTQNANLNGATLKAITCYASAGARSVNLTGTINILDSLSVRDNVNLSAGTGLTIKANNPIKGRVGMLGTGASISGNVTVETLIPGGQAGWSLLGINGVQSQNLSTWDKYPANPNGLPMTCHGCTYDINSLGGGPFYSVQGWNELTNDYDTAMAVMNSNTALTPGKGFWVYVGNSGNTDIRLSNTGALQTGPLSVNVTAFSSGYNLLANPYPCPISWDKVWNLVNLNFLNVDPTIYVYNPDNGYSDFTADFGGGFGTGDLLTGIIPAGQGFYVNVSSATTVDFDEIAKVDMNTGGILKPAASAGSQQSFRLKVTGSLDHDDGAFRFLPNATGFYDRNYDSRKLFATPGYYGYPGSYDKYTSISSKDAFNEDYSVQALPLLTQSLSVPLLVRVSTSGTYTISAYDFRNFTSCVTLHDKLTNTYHDIKAGDYICNISDTTSAPRFDVILCKDESITETGIAELSSSSNIRIGQDQQGAFVKTAFQQSTKATISAYNLVGQKLMEDIEVEGTATSTRLPLNHPNEVIFIRVVSEKETSTKKMVLH